MVSLQTMLNQCTHRHLELIARAHKLPFTRRLPKAQGMTFLSHKLHSGVYQKAFKSLTSDHIRALQALVARGGWLPLPQFVARFGEIRPYKPWRVPLGVAHAANQKIHPRHPWRYPASVAERLYHLGFITISAGDMVGIVDEVRALLPPLPSPSATAQIWGGNQDRLSLLRDTAALLGVMLRVGAAPVHGRWLSLAVLREVNEWLQIKEDLTAVRSELQTGRLRWLHYLALVGGLLSVQGGVLKPTVKAWDWLSWTPQDQWNHLLRLVRCDLEAAERLWDVFRFPQITVHTWDVLCQKVEELSPAHTYRIKDFFNTLEPYLLTNPTYETGCVLRDMFTWSGMVLLNRGRIFIHTRNFELSTRAIRGAELNFTLPASPSPAFVILLSFAQIAEGMIVIDKQAIVNALRQGLGTADIVRTVELVRGQPLSDDARGRIHRWFKAANHLTLKPIIVLQATDAETLRTIRADWRLAEHFGEQLSPTHLTVAAEDADRLLSRLERRGLEVTSLIRPRGQRRITETLNSDMAEYLLLAVRTYQKLHSRLNAGIYIPKALTHWLAAQVENPAAIEASAETLVAAVQKRVPATRPDEGIQDEQTIQRWVAFACQRQQPLTIDYFSPTSNGRTSRTIHIETIYDANDVTYLDAYCELAGQVLTFRMDRILRIYAPEMTQSVAG